MNKCHSCGAPLEISCEKCPYCGTVTPYGEEKFRERESQKKDDERRKALENLPAMKFVAMSFIAVLYIFTLGLYSVCWYALRMKPLNSLSTKTKLPAWLVAVFAILYAGLFLMPPEISEYIVSGVDEETAYTVFDIVLALVILSSGWLAFITRKILQEHAANFMEKSQAVNVIAPSGVMLILFGAGYLQSQVNRMIKINMFSPQV
ncbi:MAG: hypothetical protein IKQ95_02575 [Synergistaceae bacterium]|nr:hypothetical protein [Synergistaceae bacterium]